MKTVEPNTMNKPSARSFTSVPGVFHLEGQMATMVDGRARRTDEGPALARVAHQMLEGKAALIAGLPQRMSAEVEATQILLERPCVCGGTVVAEGGAAALIQLGIETHNRQPGHVAWQRRRASSAARERREAAATEEQIAAAAAQLAEDPEFREWRAELRRAALLELL